VRRSLTVALAAAALAFALFAAAGVRAGWRLAGGGLWRWVALLLALGAWAVVLVPWRRRWARLAPAEHERGMYRALGAWAITDVVAVLAWAG
jgi:hypothetical protein